MLNPDKTPAFFNAASKGHFPGLLGIETTRIEEGELEVRMEVKSEFFAPNGFLHAGSIVTLADTAAGYASIAHLPEGAKSFTTLELKTNFMGAAREGHLTAICSAEHLGRSTHVWSVSVVSSVKQKQIALFTCTQLILY